MNNEIRYNVAVRILHWLVFLAALIAVVAIELDDSHDGGPSVLFRIHQSAGLAVFALMSLRLLVRLATPVPAPLPGPRRIGQIAALTHGVLYLLMLAMPVLGVLAVAWSGEPVDAFGMTLSLPLTPSRSLAHFAREIHESGATFVYIFVGLHAVGALWHQFVVRDGVMRRIW